MLSKMKGIIENNGLGEFVAKFAPGMEGNKSRVKQLLAGRKNASTLETVFLNDCGRALVVGDMEATIIPIMETVLEKLAEKVKAAADAVNPLGAKAKTEELQMLIRDEIAANSESKKVLFDAAYNHIANTDAVKGVLEALEKTVDEADAKGMVADALVVSACLSVMVDAAASVSAMDLSTKTPVSAVVVPPAAASAAHTANPNPDPVVIVEPEPSDGKTKTFELAVGKLPKKVDNNAAKAVYNKVIKGLDTVNKTIASRLTDTEKADVDFHKGIIMSSFPHNMKDGTVDITPIAQFFAGYMRHISFNDVKKDYKKATTAYAAIAMIVHRLMEATIVGSTEQTVAEFFNLSEKFAKVVNEVLTSNGDATVTEESFAKLLEASGIKDEDAYTCVTRINKLLDTGSSRGVGILVGMQLRQADQFVRDGAKFLQTMVA